MKWKWNSNLGLRLPRIQAAARRQPVVKEFRVTNLVRFAASLPAGTNVDAQAGDELPAEPPF
jgi:hypothetical protein